MSAKATFWAWEQEVSGSNKLVLLCFAQYANDDDEAWPGKATVARLCGVDKSTVKRSVKRLCEQGYMKAIGLSQTNAADDKKRETTRYRLSCSEVTVNRVHDEPGSICCSSGVTVPPNPISNDKPTTVYIKRTDAWREFFSEYPVNKKSARNDQVAWKKATTLKLTKSDFELMRDDVKKRKALCPAWYSTFAPGITKYIDQHFWKTPITPENQHEEVGKSHSQQGHRRSRKLTPREQMREQMRTSGVDPSGSF